MPATKMSAEEMTQYYTGVHRAALKRNRADCLSAIITPDANACVNRFTDFAHRMGMKRAFSLLEAQWGSLRSRAVLDLGCGRGRWSKEYAARGAVVTGVDISTEAISALAEELPQHRFIAGDLAEMTFPDESLDVVNSVTVLQHMPEWKQRIALTNAAHWLRPGGHLVLFENIVAFDAPHVFPHDTSDWIEMAKAAGLRCTHHWGSNFELLFSITSSLSRRLRANAKSAHAAAPQAAPCTAPSLKRRVKSAVMASLAAASFPLEWACHALPVARPTHSVMIFSKGGSL
jgi:SAM-dependent methyltransferase